MTRNIFSCTGMKARRQTLLLNDERTGGKVFLWGVVEVMEPDMQDFKQGEPYSKQIGTEGEPLPLSVSWIVDYIELERNFLKNPQREYSIDGQTVRFMGETRVLEPNEDCSLIQSMDELEKNNLHVVLPKRNCTGFLNVWLDQARNTEALVNGNTQIQDQTFCLSCVIILVVQSSSLLYFSLPSPREVAQSAGGRRCPCSAFDNPGRLSAPFRSDTGTLKNQLYTSGFRTPM